MYRAHNKRRTPFAIRRLSADFGDGIQVQILFPDAGSYAGMEYTEDFNARVIEKMTEVAKEVCYWHFPKEAA